MSAPDRDRGRVYAAEEAAFAGTLAGEALGWDRFTALASQVLHALRTTALDPGPVALRRSRPDSGHSSAASTLAGGVVRVAPGHDAAATLTHELAHLVAGPDACHGPSFRAAHLAVAGVGLGERGRDVLAGEYRRHRLDVPAPTGAPTTVAAAGWGLLEQLHRAWPMGPPGPTAEAAW